MAAIPRRTVVALALVALTGATLVAGPALAQEMTDDGMGGNDTMDDGSMTETTDGNDSMGGDDMGTEDGMTTEDGMGTETMDGGSMATEDDMEGEEMTDEAMAEDDMAGETDSGGQPGFGIAVVVVALFVAAALSLRRRGG